MPMFFPHEKEGWFVRKVSTMVGEAPHELPTRDMPIGLPRMLNACLKNEYPMPQAVAAPGWGGEADGVTRPTVAGGQRGWRLGMRRGSGKLPLNSALPAHR